MRWCRAQTLLALQKLISEKVSTGARSWHGFYTEELTLRLVHLAVLIQWRLNAKTPRRQGKGIPREQTLTEQGPVLRLG
jgi:hypothetical protein